MTIALSKWEKHFIEVNIAGGQTREESIAFILGLGQQYFTGNA